MNAEKYCREAILLVRMKMITKKLLLLAISMSSLAAYAQGRFDWWNEIHQWDGVTPWERMLTSTPGYMGPNALPVPELRQGLVDSIWSFQLSSDIHWAKGDFTQNSFVQLNVPLAHVASFHIWWVPSEYFQTDTLIRDMRLGRTREARGWSTGDVYVSTQIQLLKNHSYLPDFVLGATLKTASGRRLEDSRFTNTPGYYFDMNGGKTYALSESSFIRPHAMAGLYVYQTHRNDQFQNDAFLWGLGLQWIHPQWDIQCQVAGYLGYLNDLDTPAVLRLRFAQKWDWGQVFTRYQRGNDSFPFNTWSLGLIHNSF